MTRRPDIFIRKLQRPIYGGAFGQGLYALATLPTIANGLHGVRFMVIEPRRGTVLSVADEKVQAIAAARHLLVNLPATEAANDPTWRQAALWHDMPVDRPPSVRKTSRRRRQVFERSQGRCQYCKAVLTLDGRWHVEPMVPRALGGDDGPGNLVAACVACNLPKGPRTSLEFIAAPTAPAVEPSPNHLA